MTLRCECGGAIEITDATYRDDYLHEQHKCPICGKTGGYRVNGRSDKGYNSTTYGCVTKVSDY